MVVQKTINPGQGEPLSERSEGLHGAISPVTGAVSRHGVHISDVEHWSEGEVLFVRSVEFDAYAEDEDFETAIIRLGETIEDLADFLGDLVASGDATPNELETFALLAPRLLESYRREHDDEERGRLISIRLGRRRREHRGSGTHWAPRTTRQSSSEPSPV